MGFSPVDVDRMSLWKLTAAAEGYADAHTPADKRPMSDQDFESLSDLIDRE